MNKQQYGFWNNCRWFLGQLWRTHRGLVVSAIAEIVGRMAMLILGVLLPALLVGAVGRAHAGLQYYMLIALGLAASTAVAGILSTIGGVYSFNWGSNLRSDIAVDLQDIILGVDYDQATDPTVHKLYEQAAGRGTANTSSGMQALFSYGVALIGDVLTLVVFVATLTAITPLIFVLVVLAASVAYVAMAGYRKWYGHGHEHFTTAVRKQRYLERNAYAVENGKDIRMYAMRGWYHDHLQQLLGERDLWQRRDSNRFLWANIAGAVAGIIRDAASYLYLFAGVVARTVSVSQFTLLFGMINQFVQLTDQLISDLTRVQTANRDLLEVRQLFDLAATNAHRDALVELPSALMPQASGQLPVTVEFKDVRYRYPGADADSLKDISFTLAAGEKLALVGINGAGKSTIAKLMMGLMHPTSGQILYNGIDAQTLSRQQCYDLFAPVFQETTILAMSVAQNVAPVATPDTARVQAAVDQAGLTAKVAALPQGLETPMTKNYEDDGVEFSGGQAQRLMLARALYKDAPVLILDEPTAALDPIAENEVYNEYAQLTRGKSSLFISHRLASTRFCDRIIFLADGRIVQSGTHADLMRAGGPYADMFAVQAKYYAADKEAFTDGEN
ncbi:ABC transporter ATP-binding protein [Lacticaseibacillus hulanensis]|uniref:ABC transporter ATP-binding protein n=1 Tax=Lacticaseibacillus hulanensis TaxID=2493111 RepID=UPI000FD93436|nr:ABC transporter ATP-binding protein [Lacticaseibacillus hulanensis]